MFITGVPENIGGRTVSVCGGGGPESRTGASHVLVSGLILMRLAFVGRIEMTALRLTILVYFELTCLLLKMSRGLPYCSVLFFFSPHSLILDRCFKGY